MRRFLLLAVSIASLALPATALAGGGDYGCDGGTPGQRSQVRAALEASSFDWGALRTQDGSVCFGDSAGPQLDGDTVVAITLGGGKHCKGASTAYRLDTPAARGFLSAYVALP